MVPGDQIKIILQTQPSGPGVKPLYNGPVDVFRSLWREGGIGRVYKGTGLTLLRDGPGSMAYYGSYEVMKQAMSDGEELSVAATLTAGGLAGCANWAVAVPPDTIKSRLQSAPEGRYPGGMA